MELISCHLFIYRLPRGTASSEFEALCKTLIKHAAHLPISVSMPGALIESQSTGIASSCAHFYPQQLWRVRVHLHLRIRQPTAEIRHSIPCLIAWHVAASKYRRKLFKLPAGPEVALEQLLPAWAVDNLAQSPFGPVNTFDFNLWPFWPCPGHMAHRNFCCQRQIRKSPANFKFQAQPFRLNFSFIHKNVSYASWQAGRERETAADRKREREWESELVWDLHLFAKWI